MKLYIKALIILFLNIVSCKFWKYNWKTNEIDSLRFIETAFRFILEFIISLFITKNWSQNYNKLQFYIWGTD